jgi:hypothetical protein
MVQQRRPWTKTSASQHGAFQRCQRYWYYGWIERLPRPTSDAMQRGKDIHTEIEHYLLNGNVRDSSYTEAKLNYRPYVEALVPYLPPPKHEDLIIEHPVLMDTGLGVEWVGFIDIGFSGSPILRIRDTKSTSNFRYAKTPVELAENIQVISYAVWAYNVVGYSGSIDLGHLYVQTEKNRVPKKPKTMEVDVVLDQWHVLDVWARELKVVSEMKAAALVPSAHELPPNTNSCGMYGGCPYRNECGIDLSMSALLNKNKGKNIMGFLDKIKNKEKNKGTLPPDAPSRETSDEEAEEITESAADKKKRLAAERKAKKAKKEAEKEAAEKEAAEKEAAAPKEEKKNGKSKSFVIYIDCMPTKDVHADGVEPTLFEDWFAPLVMSMNEYVKEQKKLDSYLLLPYAEEKALVMMAVQDAVARLPPALVINSGVPGAKDALGALVPHASLVVRALRG